jgi:hypothetical protein
MKPIQRRAYLIYLAIAVALVGLYALVGHAKL